MREGGREGEREGEKKKGEQFYNDCIIHSSQLLCGCYAIECIIL